MLFSICCFELLVNDFPVKFYANLFRQHYDLHVKIYIANSNKMQFFRNFKTASVNSCNKKHTSSLIGCSISCIRRNLLQWKSLRISRQMSREILDKEQVPNLSKSEVWTLKHYHKLKFENWFSWNIWEKLW